MISMPCLLMGSLLVGNLQASTARHVSRLAGGALEVVSATPGVTVRVDGDMLGRTPLRVAGLALGPHRVEVAGAGLEVLVKEGLLTRLSSGATGLQLTSVPATPAASPGAGVSVDAGPRLAAPDWDMVRGILAQPWAYGAAAVTGVCLLGAGILWTATPDRFPVLGQLPVQMHAGQYLVLRWGSLALVGAFTAMTVTLFVLPSLPLVRDWLNKKAATDTATPSA